jgi:hypothetical protein
VLDDIERDKAGSAGNENGHAAMTHPRLEGRKTWA